MEEFEMGELQGFQEEAYEGAEEALGMVMDGLAFPWDTFIALYEFDRDKYGSEPEPVIEELQSMFAKWRGELIEFHKRNATIVEGYVLEREEGGLNGQRP